MNVSPLIVSPATAKRARSALEFGIDPDTTVVFTSFSFAPWPNELSPVPVGRSTPTDRLGALSQSWLPGVLTTKLPSLPSNVEPLRFALAPAVKNTAATVPTRARTTSTYFRICFSFGDLHSAQARPPEPDAGTYIAIPDGMQGSVTRSKNLHFSP